MKFAYVDLSVDSPLIVSPDDLAEVVQALSRQKSGLIALMDGSAHPARDL